MIGKIVKIVRGQIAHAGQNRGEKTGERGDVYKRVDRLVLSLNFSIV